MNSEKLILVDENDNITGSAGKLEVHERGLLHRAFSVFLFNRNGEMLLQQRAMGKYHSAGLWSNACCSHPLAGEETGPAVERRLKEELGIAATTNHAFHFLYKVEFSNGLTEHEFDHVYTGIYDGEIHFNPAEVMAVNYRGMPDIEHDLAVIPAQYTKWFHIAFPRIAEWHKHYFEKGSTLTR